MHRVSGQTDHWDLYCHRVHGDHWPVCPSDTVALTLVRADWAFEPGRVEIVPDMNLRYAEG